MMGRFSEAEETHRRALAIFEKSLGEEHAETVTTLHNLAFVLKEIGKLEEAESLFRRALTVTERTFGEMHAETAITVDNLAQILEAVGKFDECKMDPILPKCCDILHAY